MTQDVRQALREYFEKLDTPNNWNISVGEAVEITLARDEDSLSEDMMGEYVDLLTIQFENIAYQRNARNFNYVDFRGEHLEEILMLSPYAKRKLRGPYIDLSQSTEIILKDGMKIPINAHLKSKSDESAP